MTPATNKLSRILIRYCLLYVGIVLAISYVVLLGTLAEEFSERVIRNLSIFAFVLAGLAFLSGLFILPVHVRISRTSPASTMTKVGRLVSTGIVSLPTAFLLLMLCGACIALWQLSFGQFLLGSAEEQYPHLIILSGYAGATFGIYAGWNAKTSHDLAWGTSISHGLRVFVETGFLAYAGLWLVKDPFDLIAGAAETRNWELITPAMIGTALIGIGTFSFMARQAATTPQRPKSDQSFGALIQSSFQKALEIIRVIMRKQS